MSARASTERRIDELRSAGYARIDGVFVDIPVETSVTRIGAELAAPRDTTAAIPLAASHEHVVFVATGSAQVRGSVLRPGQLLYLDPGAIRSAVRR